MRSLLCALVLQLVPAGVQAHWVWIFPDTSDATKVNVVFGHHVAPADDSKLLDKIVGAKLWIRTAGGDKPVEWKRGENQYTFAITGPMTVGGVNEYGVVQKGTAKPFRLVQCPKLVLGNDDKPWAKLPLEIVPKRDGDSFRLTVYYQGKRAPAGLEVTIHAPDDQKVPILKTDDQGTVVFRPEGTGLFGFTVPYTVAEAGEANGKKYEETRYSASLVLNIGEAKPAKR